MRCPEGHESTDADWCSTCGAPMATAGPDTKPTPVTPPTTAPAPAPAPPTPAATKPCPDCGAANVEDALFCEDCGYDFTTGQRAPAPSSLTLDPKPVATTWVAEVWVDPGWFEANADTATEPCPAAGLPSIVLLRNDVILLGRASASKGILPDIDCSADTGVSRRHLQLTLEQDRWYVEDLGSTNGTFVAAGDGTLPSDPIPPNRKRELGDNERIYVGAWTRVVVRPATAAEGGA